MTRMVSSQSRRHLLVIIWIILMVVLVSQRVISRGSLEHIETYKMELEAVNCFCKNIDLACLTRL